MKKVNLVAFAVTTALTSGFVAAAETKGTDILTDGWEFHGYLSSNYRLIDGDTSASTFDKGDYHVAGGSATSQSTNQVEFTVKKATKYQNGVFANYNLRAEYGNENSFAYSSSGNQKNNTDSQFEIKEAFIEIGALPYFGTDTVIWAGQRYLNRSAGMLSGEFWRQSSGLGGGFETKLAGNKFGIALISADPKSTLNPTYAEDTDSNSPTFGNVIPSYSERKTLTSLDFYYHGVDLGFGALDLDAKFMVQDRTKNSDPNEAQQGIGLSATLNTNYYGLDGWAQTGIAYGSGMATNRGVNFGEWNDNFLKDDHSVFLTSYGVWNVNDRFQLGTEITHWELLEVGKWEGLDGGSRTMVAARPSFIINDNFRFEFTGSYAYEKVKKAEDGQWVYIEAAPVFTVNADLFGRPQIKPYVAYIKALEDGIGNKGIDGSPEETVFGVHAELWF